LAALLSATPTLAQSPARPAYRSPSDVAFSPDGALLAVADRTWPGLVLVNSSDGSVAREVKLWGDPSHVVWNGSEKVLVAEGNNGSVAEIEAASGTVLRRFAVGLVARGLAVTSGGERLLTCDRAANKLVVVKLASGHIEFTIPVGREPGTIAITKDGKVAFVGNKLPRPGDPSNGTAAAEISKVDLTTKQVVAIPLVKQATMVRQVVLSKDEKWLYVTHQSPRGWLPVTQLDNGWVMANALSVIDATAGSVYANFIFDRGGSGAAHPWGAAISPDGSKLWVALEGVREVATVDLTKLHTRLSGTTDVKKRTEELIFNLSDLHTDGTIKRTVLTGIDGPRGVALLSDKDNQPQTLAVTAYFSGKVLLLSPTDLSVTKTITLPNNPSEDQIRMGERYFHSAMNCYQGWLSCSSCHDEGHADGLNWDLQNDGVGNPKQTKSLVLASVTPPAMVTGARENAEVATRAGYQYLEFQASPEERVQATYAFVKSLTPEPSPFLAPDGQLTAEAVEGQKLFDGQAGCAKCHAGPYFTDMKKHDVGTRDPEGPRDNPIWDIGGFDTPTLIEVWRTAPYLHLGSALTIQDTILAHVKTPTFSQQQLDQLAAYVLQIGPTRDRPVPIVVDAGAPSDAPSAPNDTAGSGGQTSTSSGGTGGNRRSGSSGSAGQSGTSTSTDPSSGGSSSAGQSGTSTSTGPSSGGSGSAGQSGASTNTGPSIDRADAGTQGATRLASKGCSCNLGKDSAHDSPFLLLLGLAWILPRPRKRH
jgi:DNA-binding beta-propeller fold protein YncE/mono/diheme cytochrome c family protein